MAWPSPGPGREEAALLISSLKSPALLPPQALPPPHAAGKHVFGGGTFLLQSGERCVFLCVAVSGHAALSSAVNTLTEVTSGVSIILK